MIFGVEYRSDHKALVTSYVTPEGNVDFIIKRLQPSDVFSWLPSKVESSFRGFDDTPLRKIETDRPSRFRLEELMHEKFTPEDWEMVKALNLPKAYSLDIETEVAENNEFPDPVEAKQPINVISIVSMHEPRVRVLTTLSKLDIAARESIMAEVNEYVKEFGETYTLDYIHFDTEKEMLEAFFYKLLPRLPLLTGWNIIEFDWQTMLHRAELHKVDVVRNLPSKVLNGQFRTPTHTAIIDYIDALLKFKPYKDPENHQLDYIATRSLGKGKLKHPYNSFYEFQQDTFMFVKYNIIDSILVRLVDKKHKLLYASYSIASIAMVEQNRIFGPVFMTEMFMCREFIKDGKFVWTKKKTMGEHEKYKGAFVKAPAVGYHKDIVCLDFKSMYPNIQIQWNISTDTYLGKKNKVDFSKLAVGSYTVTKNDTVFLTTKDSVARRIQSSLFNRRSDIQAEIKRLKLILKEDAAV